MPNTNHQNRQDMYTAMYEQYYFKNTPVKKVTPIKKAVKKKKTNPKQLVGSSILICFLLFFILPLSFNNYIKDIITANNIKFNVNYEKIMFPTHFYINKDLFLGKYVIPEIKISKPIMTNIPEGQERYGLRNSLLALSQEFKRISPAVYVWGYDDKSYVNINANTPFSAASIIKVPVLIEMFRNIEQGKFNLNDTMVFTDYYRAGGSGKLQYSQDGIAYTLDHLARIMIENSDNSSTNMIMAKIGGMPEMNRAIHRWGLKTTRINNWLPDLDGTNITTAKEMAQMFYNIDTTNILSNESKKHIADYLSHVRNNRLLQAGLPPEAILLHKTGDIGFMLGDAGIVKAPNGKKYIVVILAKRPYNNQQGKDFIVKASKIIYNNMTN